MSDQAQWLQLVGEASARVKTARTLDARWPPSTLEAADAALDAALGSLPADPGAPPPPAPQFVAPLPPGALYGQEKWSRSLGCDLFVPRGTPVFAPLDGVIEEVLGGSGLEGGDELILARPDRQLAFRYRHTRAEAQVGQRFAQGARLGHVEDRSLDQLGRVPAWFPAPDGYQHLDLSVAYGTDQFDPTGGGGGNVRAYDWLQSIGYQGTVWTRTPGPPDAGR